MPTLDWIGKKAVVGHHRQVPFHLLKSNEELSVGEAGSGNLLVQGDNLVALKALLPYYAGKVKCIYIDPPYNTGNEKWTYNDNVNSPEIRQWLGKVVGGDMEDLSRHDKWLCMMYPRLAILRELLRQDGVLLVSIDDNELYNFVVLMDEILGSQNYLATLIWEKGKKGDSKFFSETHEYIVVYARDKAYLVANNVRWKKRKEGVDKVLSYYEGLRVSYGNNHEAIRNEMMKWFRSLSKDDPAKAHKHYNWSDNRGLYFPDNFHGPDDGRENRPRYDIIHPVTGKVCAKPSTGWRWEEARTRMALAEKPPRIHFGPDETTIPCRKSYLIEIDREPFPTVFYKDGRAATLLVEQILGKGVFSFPKDVEVLAGLVGMVTLPGDLILDSFAGSGPTGHAILQLNKQEDGNRRFILVEMDENVCQNVTAERLKRVCNGYTKPNGEQVEGLGGGFRYCELGEPLFAADGSIRKEVRFADLARHVFFTETGEPLPSDVAGKSPLIGVSQGTAVYLLYNGIFGDRTPRGGNVLTSEVLKILPPNNGLRVVYGTACRLSQNRLKREGIVFRQIPYEIRVS